MDVWLGNEDRWPKNHNLLLLPSDHERRLMVIDFEAIFNTMDSNYNTIWTNAPVSDPDKTILSSISVSAQLKRKQLLTDWVQELENEFYTFVQSCRDLLPYLFATLPPEWGIPENEIAKWMDKSLFGRDRLSTAWRFFQSEVQYHLRK